MSKIENRDELTKVGLKKTKKRNMILDLIKNTGTPMTAEDIYLKLKQENVSIWISTVYRTLEALSSKGIIVKSNILNEGKASYELDTAEHKHQMVCMGCKRKVAIEDCPFEEYAKKLGQKTDFEVKGHKLEIYGYCSKCKDKT